MVIMPDFEFGTVNLVEIDVILIVGLYKQYR